MDFDASNWQVWVSIVIGVIFVGLAIRAIAKEHNILMFVVYIVLAICCFCYTALGDSILSRFVD